MSDAAAKPLDYAAPPPRRSRAGAVAPLLIAAVFAAAYAGYVGWPRWPVQDASERVAVWILVAAVIAAIADLVCDRTRRWLTPVLAFIAAAVCLWPDFEAMRTGAAHWSDAKVWIAVLVCAAIASLVGTLMALLAARDRDRPLAPLVMLGMVLASAPLAQATHSLKLGDASYCFAVAVGLVSLIGGLIFRPFARSAGAMIVASVFVAVQMVNGYLWLSPSMPIWCIACILIAAPLGWVVAVGPLARRPAWVRVTIALLIAAIPASIAVGITTTQALRELAAAEANEPAW